jgi:protein TonB
VTVRVLVGTDGAPASVTVRATSGHEDFDSAAVQAVKKWRFSPARRGGTPVASFHDVRIRFRLDEAR